MTEGREYGFVKDECKHQLKGDASKVFEYYELM